MPRARWRPLSVGSAVFISVYVSLMGGLQALLPIWAELHGGRRTAEVGRSLRQSLYLCAAAIALGMALLLFPAPLLRWTEVPAAMRADVEAYLRVLAFALAPALLFRLFSTLSQSLGKPQLVTWLQLASLGLKLPLSIWFTFGGAGLPAMGRWAAAGPRWWSTTRCSAPPSGSCAAIPSTPATASGSASSGPTGGSCASSPGWACRPAFRCWSK